MESTTKRHLLICTACIFFIGIVLNFDKLFYINVTSSLPRGLYMAVPGELHRGDYVIYDPSPFEKKLLEERAYTKEEQVILKQVGGLPNDSYTITRNLELYINNERKGEVFPEDQKGRSMPFVVGTHLILDDEFFPYAPAKRSLDGRYFGPEKQARIISKVIPVCTEIW